MILFVGDSNLRNVIEENQSLIKTKLKEDVIFEQAGQNESLRSILDDAIISNYSKVIIGTLLNEIGVKGKTVRTRDEVINQVTKEQVDIISKHVGQNPDTKFIVLPPFVRFEPAWIPDKIRTITLHLKDHVEKINSDNIEFGRPIDITEADLNDDKVHLNEHGKTKLLNSIIGTQPQQITSWAATPRVTRSTTKRVRGSCSSDDSDVIMTKKVRNEDLSIAILDKLNTMTEELREERIKSAERSENILAKLNVNIESTSTNSKKIEDLTKKQANYNSTVASLREDLDAVDNEAMRNVILIRKLSSNTPIPQQKDQLSTFLRRIANDLVVKLGGKPEMVKFVTMAYNELDAAKQQRRKSSVPTFKIGFKFKEDAIYFKEAGTRNAKDKGSDLHKVVFAYQSCSATRIRIQIMWIIVNKLKADGKEAWVNATTTKPKLQVKVPDRNYPVDYTYVNAVEKFGDLLSDADLKEINIQAKKFFKGKCEQFFLILKD
jgi:hypothetical protein